MKIQEIKNTLGPHQRETLVLRKGDVGGTVHFTVPDLTGITSADFRLIKPDGTFVVKSGDIVQNTVIVQIAEQMCTVYGSGIYNLELKASGVSVYTAIGRCLIDKNIDLNDYAASVAEVNGLVFPDDFLTSTDLSDYATKTYVDTSISTISTITLNYSTAEQNTGLKWIDNKPIYQKTIYIENGISLPANVNVSIQSYVSDLNIELPIDCLASRFTTSNRGGASVRVGIWLDGGSLKLIAPTTWNFMTYLTIWYTKTTDTV